MNYTKQIIFSISILIIVSGCSFKGNEFTANFDTVNELKDKDLKSVSVEQNKVGEGFVSLGRGTNKMSSPYGGSFQEYLSIALKEELYQVNIYDKESDIEINTRLLENIIDTGISIGKIDLGASFTIKNNKKEVHRKIYNINHSWKSSFAAATAIPTTLENYPIAMQKLIDKFLLDEDVQKILKK